MAQKVICPKCRRRNEVLSNTTSFRCSFCGKTVLIQKDGNSNYDDDGILMGILIGSSLSGDNTPSESYLGGSAGGAGTTRGWSHDPDPTPSPSPSPSYDSTPSYDSGSSSFDCGSCGCD